MELIQRSSDPEYENKPPGAEIKIVSLLNVPNPTSIKVSRYVPEGALKKVSAVAVVFVGP